ncbi:transcriptional regulator [Niallia circulans]|uniref:LCP family protein n=1 Tax=Niallia circulans TaxID=1397 RepID=UPI000BA58DB8|nr:LCP family protein [Niallia circulans]PAD26583.1 transcriptional regulator [Niallia circulans]
MENNTRVKRKKGIRWKRVFGFAILIFALAVFYSVYQYNKGLKQATQTKGNNKIESSFEDFEGPEPQFGEINIMLLGSDSRGEEHARTDTLMIVHYNQNTHKMKIASIMRDIYVNIPEIGYQKMNAAFAYGGPELVRKTLKENFGIDINYYAIADFEGFSKIVDIVAPKGIEVDIPYEMSYGIGMTLHPGKQVLHGDQLLGYVRFRHDRLSDFGRVERQQEAIEKLKEQAVSMHSVVNLPKILGTVTPYIETNLDTPTILSITKGLVVNKSDDLDRIRIPVQNSYENDTVNVGAVLKIDMDENAKVLNEFLADGHGLVEGKAGN